MQLLTFLSLILSSSFVFSNPKEGALVRGNDLSELKIEQLVAEIPSNAILVIGEQHDINPLAQDQLRIFKALKSAYGTLNVGMEFLSWPDQAITNDYKAGLLSEADFLAAIKWGGMNFDNYREQILFPQSSLGEVTLALNAPRSLTGRISKVGVDGLTEAEKALMPPDFQLGRPEYLERFKEIMGGHVPESALAKYFAAQSVWDETMAWKASLAPEDRLLVIVVGEFHVQYGGGLPDRLKARYPNRPIVTLSQIVTDGATDQEINEMLTPNGKYGKRADYLLVY